MLASTCGGLSAIREISDFFVLRGLRFQGLLDWGLRFSVLYNPKS